MWREGEGKRGRNRKHGFPASRGDREIYRERRIFVKIAQVLGTIEGSNGATTAARCE
jgi:hypothetical protein